MNSPQPLPPHADLYFESQADPQSYVDLTGVGPQTQRLVLWSRRTRRELPRLFQPIFRSLAVGLCFLWFACEEIQLWWKQLDWPNELRVLSFAVWTLIVLIVGLMLFDLLLTYNSAGMVR